MEKRKHAAKANRRICESMMKELNSEYGELLADTQPV